MPSVRPTIVLVLALLLAVPITEASWSAKGVREPDTRRDATDGHMFLTPDTSATGAKVYFNGFMGNAFCYVCAGATVSGQQVNPITPWGPNVDALGSRHQGYPFVAWAMLGVWKDCNRDGYIGLGDQAWFEYRAELLPDTATCPVNPIPANWLDYSWTPVHNDGQWVHEFLPIGWDYAQYTGTGAPSGAINDTNPWNLNDSGARVWSDWNLPESLPQAGCWVNPQPRGTYQSTGGFLEWSDCFLSYRITDTINQQAAEHPELADASFADAPRDQSESSSVLNQRNPWGREYDPSLVSAWECDADPLAKAQDPTWDGQSGASHQYVTYPPVPAAGLDGDTWVNASNSDGYFSSVPGVVSWGYVNVSAVGSPTVDPAGSPGGTVNETEAGADQCERRTDGDFDDGDLPYANEADLTNDNLAKTQSDQSLDYYEGNRNTTASCVQPVANDPSTRRCAPENALGRGQPADQGLRHTSYEGFWRGFSVTAASRNPYVDRGSLAPMKVTYISYYATVGAGAIAKYGLTLPPASGAYGSATCTTIGTGAPVQNGWACDPDLWWADDTMPRTSKLGRDPADPARTYPYGVRVGQPFQLRDIDCYDESVNALRDQGIGYGILTNTRCV